MAHIIWNKENMVYMILYTIRIQCPLTGIQFLREVTVASFYQFIYPISFHRYTLVENPEILILQN